MFLKGDPSHVLLGRWRWASGGACNWQIALASPNHRSLGKGPWICGSVSVIIPDILVFECWFEANLRLRLVGRVV
jgi:hypothetical protein